MTFRPRLEYEDIQGNVLQGYGDKFRYAAFLTVELRDARGGRRLLAELAGRVTDSQNWKGREPQETLNVAVSYAGLERLGVPDETLRDFPPEFADGMAARAEELGDVGLSAPSHWEKGLLPGQVHLLVIVHARDRTRRNNSVRWLEETAADCGAAATRELADRGKADVVREHFGFNDGYGQPAVRGQLSRWYRGQGTLLPRKLGRWIRLGNAWRWVAPGEFIMGYRDEDGPPEGFAAKPLARNGTFMVYRKFKQDVAAFEQLIGELADEHFSRDFELAAAKVAGRWRDGTPVVASPGVSKPSIAEDKKRTNAFRYHRDPQGYLCPLGAHVRRANPRDALFGKGQRTRRHRIIRRGMPYGPRSADGAGEAGERGLLFVCFNASIARQFEVVNGWLTDGDVFGLDGGDLLTDRTGRPAITIQGDPPIVFAPRCPRGPLVTVCGGEYLFLPGRRALAALATGSLP